MDSRILLAGLAGLAEQRTSLRRGLRFQKHADCFEEISRLEGLLGVAHSQPPNNIVAANLRAQELERLVNLQIARTAPAPAAPPEAFPGASIIASLEAITDPSDRTEFYRGNKFAIDRAYRNAPPPKFTHKPTGVGVVDQMNALEDPRARTAFYRKHKTEIDSAYKTCNL